MTRADVHQLFLAGGIAQVPVLLDDAFRPVSLAFIREVWGLYVQNLPVPLQNPVDLGGGLIERRPLYVPIAYDCNKIVRGFVHTLFECIGAQVVVNKIDPYAPAAGPISFLIDGKNGQGHDIVWYTEDGTTLSFFDPQMYPTPRPMNDAEKASVFFNEAA